MIYRELLCTKLLCLTQRHLTLHAKDSVDERMMSEKVRDRLLVTLTLTLKVGCWGLGLRKLSFDRRLNYVAPQKEQHA
jgi:hypothetical protein